jgi:hypothetical protein
MAGRHRIGRGDNSQDSFLVSVRSAGTSIEMSQANYPIAPSECPLQFLREFNVGARLAPDSFLNKVLSNDHWSYPMSTVAELKELREKMIERLTQIPEYQALKAMDRFIGEISGLFEVAAHSNRQEASAEKPASVAVDNKQKNDAVSNASSRVTPYIPAQRVA